MNGRKGGHVAVAVASAVAIAGWLHLTSAVRRHHALVDARAGLAEFGSVPRDEGADVASLLRTREVLRESLLGDDGPGPPLERILSGARDGGAVGATWKVLEPRRAGAFTVMPVEIGFTARFEDAVGTLAAITGDRHVSGVEHMEFRRDGESSGRVRVQLRFTLCAAAGGAL